METFNAVGLVLGGVSIGIAFLHLTQARPGAAFLDVLTGALCIWMALT